MTQHARVLVVGEAITVFVNTPAQPARQYRGPFVSGAPVIFASATARLGATVELVAAVGADDFGRQFSEQLGDHGVGLTAATVDADRPTSCAFVKYRRGGGRDFIFYLDGTAALDVAPDALQRLVGDRAFGDAFEWVHVSGTALTFGGGLAETCWSAVQQALEAGVPVSFDPNVRDVPADGVVARRVGELVDRATVVLASEGELERLGGAEADVVARGGVVCHKLGARGAVVVDASGRHEVPAVEVVEVDPDGAGDVFAAGFVAATLLGYPAVDAAAVGCRVAAESVQVWGPLESHIEALVPYPVIPSG